MIQCSPVKNSSTLLPFKLQTDKVIGKVSFSEDDITQIIKKLNPNKLHDWDNISVRMTKFCYKPVSYPLKLIFQASFQEVIFPDSKKKTNILPIHMKERKIY